MQNVDLFETSQLSKLPRSILEELDLRISTQTRLPLRGRRLLFVTEEVEPPKRPRFRELFVKQLTTQGELKNFQSITFIRYSLEVICGSGAWSCS